ncbi:ROK family protein [Halomonas sp. ZH2S]|uniref:ROK family protein n=1 Tax=Vreelandella zhuhanensis TaxID=2684210 RepID=A0A7X3H245_9GAMM|nr:ROK family protein [Halomonas zhuhanensis]MWJ29132.1 ROK family protein [Halomonas zhuhanensis]
MYILFDIGGSKTRVAASNDCHELQGDPIVFDSTSNSEADTKRIADAARMLVGGHGITAAAGGVAGVLDSERRRLLRSPNKTTWVGEPLAKQLEKGLGVPVFLENDTDLAGLGEAHVGAGKGYEIVAYLSVSTGIGGGRIVGGMIDAARLGFEPGHQIINPHCRICPDCVVRPIESDACVDLEGLASGTALEKRTGKKPYEVTDKEEWHRIACWLAMGLNNTLVHWSPDAIVLGGSMICGMKGTVVSLDEINRHLRELLTIFPEPPDMRLAQLGDFGGLYGAMARLRQDMKHRPAQT